MFDFKKIFGTFVKMLPLDHNVGPAAKSLENNCSKWPKAMGSQHRKL